MTNEREITINIEHRVSSEGLRQIGAAALTPNQARARLGLPHIEGVARFKLADPRVTVEIDTDKETFTYDSANLLADPCAFQGVQRIWDQGKLVWESSKNDGNALVVVGTSAADADRFETAAWYGRGEKPEHEPLDWIRFEIEAKAPKPGLLIVAGEGRYQGLGFNGAV